MATLVNILQGHLTQIEFDSIPTFILGDGQIVWLKDNSGKFKKGDGITILSVLPFLGGSSQDLAQTLLNGNTTGANDIIITSPKEIKSDVKNNYYKPDDGLGNSTIESEGDINIISQNGQINITGDVFVFGNKVEDISNKQNSLTPDGTGTKYVTVDAVNTGLSNINTNSVEKLTVKLSENITKGQAVYISSANGTNIIVSKASNAIEATSSKTLGLLETTGVTNDIVNVITDGLLSGLNTSTATIGDAVWLGTSGNLIFGLSSKPVAPAHLVYIGVVSCVHAVNGEILIKVQNGFELDELHDVNPSLSVTTSVNSDNLLIKEASSGLWKSFSWSNLKSNLKTYFDSIYQNALGYTPENVANKVTTMTGNTTSNLVYLSAKAVYDWATSTFTTTSAVATQITAALSGYATQSWVTSQGYITNVITALGYTPANKAGDTFTGNISATNLIGTNTGDETTATIKSKLGASNTSTDGYLTSTDWNTFNNKGTGTIKGSVSATAGLIPTGTGVADTVTTSANFIYNGTQLNIGGTTTGTYPGGRLRINATGTSGNTISILDSVANSVQAFSIEENSSNYFSFGRYNSGWTGNFLGTSVPFSNSAIFVSGNNGTLRVIINGSTIVNLIGSLSSNYSTVSDSTGVRIDTNNNIHTGNLNAFTVNGKSFFGGNISATAYTDINASTTSNASLRIRTGVLPTTQLDGEINYVNTRLRHYNGADNTIAYLSDNATQLNTAAINVNVPANNSLIVVRKYKINSGIKLIVGSGGRFKVQ